MAETHDILIDAVTKLKRLIASSSCFQAEVAKYSEEDAEAHIHICVAGDGRGMLGDVPRPWALIELEDRNKTRNAGGQRNTFDGDGWLKLSFFGDLDDPHDAGPSLLRFAGWAYDVLEDMCELAGYDDNLNIAEAQQDENPTMIAPEDGNEVPWCCISWRIQWAMY
jgi:hypothetical protein